MKLYMVYQKSHPFKVTQLSVVIFCMYGISTLSLHFFVKDAR